MNLQVRLTKAEEDLKKAKAEARVAARAKKKADSKVEELERLVEQLYKEKHGQGKLF